MRDVGGLKRTNPTPQPSDVGEVEKLLYEYHRQDDMHAFYRCRICKTQQGEPCKQRCPVPAVLAAVRTLAGELESVKWQRDESRANQHLLGNAISALIHKYGPVLIPDEQFINERAGMLDAKHADGGLLVDFIETETRSESGMTNHAAYDVMQGMLRELKNQLTDAQARESRMREALEKMRDYARTQAPRLTGNGTLVADTVGLAAQTALDKATALAGAGEGKG